MGEACVILAYGASQMPLHDSSFVAAAGHQQAGVAEMAGERRAHTRRTFDTQLRLMQIQHMLDDGEAQARAAAIARTARRDAVEALGKPGKVCGGYAEASVAD